MSQTDAVVSVESNGRILSGVGAEKADLEVVMERHAPPPPKPDPPPAPAGEVPPPVAAAPIEPEKPEPKGRQRFTQLAAERDAEKTKREALEKERDELKTKLTQPPAPVSAPQYQPPPQQQAQQLQGQGWITRPQPTEDEIGSKYQSYGDFVIDSSRWVMQEEHARQQIVSHQQAFNQRVEQARAKGRTAYADFDQVLQSGPGGKVDMPMDRLQAIYAAPDTEHLQYKIMKDQALAQKLATIHPIDFGIELARLSTAAPAPTNGSAPVNMPPAPIQPVGTGSKTTATPSSELAGKGFDFDRSGYREKRAQEIKAFAKGKR